MADLDRFLEAQNARSAGYNQALAEIERGGKRSHWIWYIFPQLAGLGRSPAAQTYGIAGRQEATEYLRHPVLRSRLLEITSAVAEQLRTGGTLPAVMGSDIDALKLVSSLTLFRTIAEALDDDEIREAADGVLKHAAAQGYRPCRFTLAALGG